MSEEPGTGSPCNWVNHSGCKEKAERQSGGLQVNGSEIGLIKFTSLTNSVVSFLPMIVMMLLFFGCCVLVECSCQGVSRMLHVLYSYSDRGNGATTNPGRTATPVQQQAVVAIPAHAQANVFNPIPAQPTFYNPLYANPPTLWGQPVSRRANLAMQVT